MPDAAAAPALPSPPAQRLPEPEPHVANDAPPRSPLPSASRSSGSGSNSHGTSNDGIFLVGASGAVGLLLLRSGIFNALLVLLCSGLLLCNPWIRTLLELEPLTASSSAGGVGKAARSLFDPASYLRNRRDEAQEDDAADGLELQDRRASRAGARSKTADGTDANELLDISVMPSVLRKPVDKTLPFVVRDFVQFWYEPITFAHPGFLKHSRSATEHLAASIYLQTTRMNSVDFAHNLLLTFTSLLISSLRQRRSELGVDSLPADTPFGALPDANAGAQKHSWPTTAARVASLRASIGRLLFVHLPAPECDSPLVRSLLREILVKQMWDGIVCKMGNSEFWDQKIVELHDDAKSAAPADGLPSADQKPVSRSAPVKRESADAQRSPRGTAQTPPKATRQEAEARSRYHAAAGREASPSPRGASPSPTSYQQRGTGPSLRRQSPASGGGSSSTTTTSFGRFTSNLFSGIVTAATRAGEVMGEAVDEAGEVIMGPPTVPRQGSLSTSADTGPAHDSGPTRRSGSADAPTLPPRSTATPLRMERQQERESFGDLMDFSEPVASASRTIPPRQAQRETNGRTQSDAAANMSYEQSTSVRRKPVQPYDIPEYATLEHATSRPSDAVQARSTMRQDAFRMDDSIARSDLPSDLNSVPLPDSLRAGLLAEDEATGNAADKRQSSAPLPPLLAHHPTGPSEQSDGRVAPASASLQRPSSLRNDGAPAEPTAEPSSEGAPASSTSTDGLAAAPPLASLLDARTAASSELFDAFEAYLGRDANAPSTPPPTSSTWSSSVADLDSTDQPTAGETLFRLWTQLRTLRSIGEIEMQAGGPGPADASGMRLWAEDVAGALMGRHGSASELGGDMQLERARDETLALLGRVEKHGLSALDPLEEVVEAKLQKLYAAFWVKKGSELLPSSRAEEVKVKKEERDSVTLSPSMGAAGSPSVGAVLGAITSELAPTTTSSGGMSTRTAIPGTVKAEPRPISPLPSLTQGTATPRKKATSYGPTVVTPPVESGHRRASTRTGIVTSPTASPDLSQSPVPAQRPGNAAAVPGVVTPAKLRPDQLDTMITAIFQVAHEALGLTTGSWTVRRGMLRVLEQIVRTTYTSSVVSSFSSAVSALSAKGAGEYIDATRESWWPGGEWASTPELSKEQQQDEARKRKERSVRAREIVRSYAPAQAGYLLGPGGRQACVDALDAVYTSLTHPVTALDISLTLTLEVLDSLTVGT
ncbi:hypothetical protein OC835_002846 [Tilletia horrida]|nr:hypothetical protein OC835_002846 [Tilletia horrida]